jgi:hypothetical protein
MAFQAYPAKRYHADGRAVYVQDEGEDKALGPGWSDDPDKAAVVVVETPRPKKPKGGE